MSWVAPLPTTQLLKVTVKEAHISTTTDKTFKINHKSNCNDNV